MIFHLKRFLRGVADGGGCRCAAPKAQEARNEGLATNVPEPGDAKPFKPNLRCQFYSTENSEEPKRLISRLTSGFGRGIRLSREGTKRDQQFHSKLRVPPSLTPKDRFQMSERLQGA